MPNLQASFIKSETLGVDSASACPWNAAGGSAEGPAAAND